MQLKNKVLNYLTHVGACSTCAGKVTENDQSEQTFLDDDQVEAVVLFCIITIPKSDYNFSTSRR
jgi:ferredoxin